MRLSSKLINAVTVAAAGVWFFFTPHIAVSNMRSAAESGNTSVFNDYIDYPALKENIKGTMNAKLLKSTSDSKARNPLGDLGTAFVSAMMGQLVDAFITPESVALMMKGESPKLPGGSAKKTTQEVAPLVEMKYESFNRFVLLASKPDTKGEPIGLVFHRSGFIFWKLSAIRLAE
jgi:hypothetical protein